PVAGDRANVVPGRHPLSRAILLHHVSVVMQVRVIEPEHGDIVYSLTCYVGVGEVGYSKHHAASNNISAKIRSAILVKVFHKIAFVNRELKLNAGVSRPARELKR